MRVKDKMILIGTMDYMICILILLLVDNDIIRDTAMVIGLLSTIVVLLGAEDEEV